MVLKAEVDASAKNASGRDEDGPASASAKNGCDEDDAIAVKGRNEDDQ